MEIRCNESIDSHFIIKCYKKYWTNISKKSVEGERCLQVLTDGQRNFTHDGLLFELKDYFSFENCLKKLGSQKTTVQLVPKHEYENNKSEFQVVKKDLNMFGFSEAPAPQVNQ